MTRLPRKVTVLLLLQLTGLKFEVRRSEIK